MSHYIFQYPASSGTGPSQKSDTDPAVNPVKPPTQAAAAASLTRSAWGSGHVPSTILANSSSIQQNSGNSESWPSLGGAPPMNKVQAGGAAPTAAQAEPTQPAVVLSDNEENMSHDENGTQDENMPEITTCTGGTSDEVTPDGSESGISRKVGRRQPDYGSEEDNSPPRPAFRSQFSSSLPVGADWFCARYCKQYAVWWYILLYDISCFQHNLLQLVLLHVINWIVICYWLTFYSYCIFGLCIVIGGGGRLWRGRHFPHPTFFTAIYSHPTIFLPLFSHIPVIITPPPPCISIFKVT